MKDGIVNKNYDFDQHFQLSPSTPSLKTVGERVKLIKPANIPYKISSTTHGKEVKILTP